MIPVTVVEAGPCTVIARRTQQRDGYSALQLGFGSRRVSRVSKAVRGHLRAAAQADTPPEQIREVRLSEDPQANVGDKLTVSTFAKDEFVDVTGVTKGRGFAGVVKRWRFAGGRASHGGGWVRRPGSIGMKTWPARVYKGRRMGGHMGNVRRTVQNLRVVDVRPDENLLLVRGAIPGANGGFILVRSACKK
jgi:large subunit ribosomal protein L3